jgi:hypothetical protein
MGIEFVGASGSSFGIAEIIGRDLTEFDGRLVPHVNPPLANLDVRHHVSTKVIVWPTQMDLQYTAVRSVAQSLSSAFLLRRFVIGNEALHMMLKKERPDGSGQPHDASHPFCLRLPHSRPDRCSTELRSRGYATSSTVCQIQP